jgi:hypothetical protein
VNDDASDCLKDAAFGRHFFCLFFRSECEQRGVFSTRNVDVLWKSLWKNHIPGNAIKHLARSDEMLRRKCVQFSTTIVESVW